jgi:uncharacterized protein YdiU (UPF0061 family)
MSKRTVQAKVNPKQPKAARSRNESYAAFDAVDGRHPWQDSVPEGFVSYQVRKLDRAKVTYFNFALAREMGLISTQHANELTAELSAKIIDTFALQIINEYDISKGFRAAKDSIKPHPYMATRYLQLQHQSKRGFTSGDGRSIWNGVVEYKGVTWDVSSRGTGVTCLAPGAVEANEPLKTGGGEFGYGCGQADTTELLGSAIMSEIFHLNGIETERVLTVIDLGKGCGIGVRASENLLRPAHLFLFLKQGRLEPLRKATDYFIERQIKNRAWRFSPRSPDRYRLMLAETAAAFAKFGAALERNYIFAWLDWDGDNLLASAGIIDYGSIRQFGLRHDQYRYDDVQRYSTNLNEQRGKARLTVQVFAQLVDFLSTGRRRALEDFANHESVRTYDRVFDLELRKIFLNQIGLENQAAEECLKKNRAAVEKLYAAFLVLEKTKTKTGTKKLPDGINRPAVFNMRAALRELPRMINELGTVQPQDLIGFMTSSFAKRADVKLKGALHERVANFISAYRTLLQSLCDKKSEAGVLKGLALRAGESNRRGRITGNAAEFIVDAVLKARRKGIASADVQAAVDLFIASQAPTSGLSNRRAKAMSVQSPAGTLLQELITLALDFEEDI